MKYRLTLVAFVVGLLGLVSAFTYAQNLPTVTGTPAASSVIQQDIFVRGGPGRDYLPVGKLLAGDHVRPLSRNAQGDWVLIVYGKSFGWIRRDLAFWVENVDTLPIIDVANLTPSPVLPTTPTLTPLLLPTDTPAGNWVQLNGDAQSGFVRAGPGRTYLRLGQLLTGDSVTPLSRNADGSWIMIRYGDGFGWVARNLVLWVDNLDTLPVIELGNLTPSATFTATDTSTPTATSTSTSIPSATATETFTVTPSFTPTVTPSATVTSTQEPTLTSTPIPSATDTVVPTSTSTARPSETPLPTLTPTFTSTINPTSTFTLVPSSTSTPIPSATDTVVPTSTSTARPSETPLPTLTSTFTFTATTIPSAIPTVVEAAIVPSATVEVLPTLTESVTAIPPTNTVLPSATDTATVTPSLTLTATPVPPTDTAIPLATDTASVTAVIVPTGTSSPVVNQASTATRSAPTATVPEATQVVSPTSIVTLAQTAISGVGGSTVTPNAPVSIPPANSSIAPEVLIAAVVLVAILAYAVLYWRGISGSERYASGFVVDTCPVCGRGHLIVESRQERLFGIPRSRHSVRCSECRSILREVSPQHWRYAVDPIENPDLYQRLNGQIIDNQTLIDLAHNVSPRPPSKGATTQATPPDFIDDDP